MNISPFNPGLIKIAQGESEMSTGPDKKSDAGKQENSKFGRTVATGIVLGILGGAGFGLAMGLALGKIILGLAVGIGIGSAIGVSAGAGLAYQRKND